MHDTYNLQTVQSVYSDRVGYMSAIYPEETKEYNYDCLTDRSSGKKQKNKKSKTNISNTNDNA